VLDERLCRSHFDGFSFEPPPELRDARSILIVAVPTPQMRVFLHWKSRGIAVTVPPTYADYTARTEETQRSMAAWLGEQGYRLAKPLLPLKTLAVCSTLAEYGRNNICYVAGMGSFLQLVGAFSDIPCDSDPWREAKALDRCSGCAACVRVCPTGAIPEDRFLLHAERCLTLHNEARDDFPEWIDPQWHHCWLGCMRCQAACPENKSKLGWYEDLEEFSEEETECFMRGAPFESLPQETRSKWRRLGINEEYPVLCRNLAVIIDRECPSA